MDEWCWQESVLSKRERVMEELIQGREFASQLSRVLDHHHNKVAKGKGKGKAGELRSSEALVNKILGKFSNSLLMIFNPNDPHHHDRSSWPDNHHHHGIIKSEVSHDGQESCRSTSTVKNRRGTYKRRKTSHSWTQDTTTLTDDGYAWRKYGQKVIHNAQHSRHYFRCTHRFDQSCPATKHVQQIGDDPIRLYRTTYYDSHTCRDDYYYAYASDHELGLDCSSLSPRDQSSKFISFSNANLTGKQQEHPFFSSFTSSSSSSSTASSAVKKEVIIKEQKPTSNENVLKSPHNCSSSCDYFVPPDLMAIESFSGPSNLGQLDDDEHNFISRMMAMVESYEFGGDTFSFDC